MKIGMLWLDDEKRPLSEKVMRAAEYYEAKYGRYPDTCQVNEGMLDVACDIAGIRVEPARYVLPHHLWLGLA